MEIKTRVGNTPEPDDLIGRDRLLSRIWSLLPEKNILLLAPRNAYAVAATSSGGASDWT
ncbi:MAG: hypothetical protein HYZ53_07110 [Planctomycetes bacterium]|nr:hypothetical protein [Planctomycetota bacterium]